MIVSIITRKHLYCNRKTRLSSPSSIIHRPSFRYLYAKLVLITSLEATVFCQTVTSLSQICAPIMNSEVMPAIKRLATVFHMAHKGSRTKVLRVNVSLQLRQAREGAGIRAAGPSALDVFDGAVTRYVEDAVRRWPGFFRQAGDMKGTWV
jgi:hypothetical protein